MRKVFADSAYWIALINPKDQWRPRAIEISRELGEFSIITTDEILTETLNYLKTDIIQRLERKRPACHAVEKRQNSFRALALMASGTLALQSAAHFYWV